MAHAIKPVLALSALLAVMAALLLIVLGGSDPGAPPAAAAPAATAVAVVATPTPSPLTVRAGLPGPSADERARRARSVRERIAVRRGRIVARRADRRAG